MRLWFVLVAIPEAYGLPFRLKLNHVSQFKYSNSMAVHHTYTDHLGNEHEVLSRDDVQLTRDVFYFSGFVFDPNLDFNILLYTSSACIYPGYLQREENVRPLKESDAYPADAEDGYGWEKLYAERMCRHYTEDFGLETRVVRFHNIFGPLGTFDGGREKSPAAICRKIALAENGGTIEVWGDGCQTRSYCYIDDCIEGIYRLMQSHYGLPINLGQDRMISINELVDIVAAIAGKEIHRSHNLNAPQGVRGRNSDNTLLRAMLGWEPAISLEIGLARTYKWICSQLEAAGNCHQHAATESIALGSR